MDRSAVAETVFELKTNRSHCILESREQVIGIGLNVKTVMRMLKRYSRENVETFLIDIIQIKLTQFDFCHVLRSREK